MSSATQHGRPVSTGLALRLWEAAEGVAMESLHSPFVTGMAQGTLPRSAFQHYVGQNGRYLQFFAKAYALAMSKCDPSRVSKETFDHLGEMLRGVHDELRLHTSYAVSWGVDLATVHPSPATLAYTDFLMEVANDPNMGLAELICAMAPCARLYGWLGCTLAAAFPGADHPYSHWVETYSSDEYMRIPDLKERMLEEAAEIFGSDEARLQRLYTRAMQLEVDFFNAHPSTPAARPIRSLVVDFDDTCTAQDTCSVLFEAAALAKEKAGGPAAGQAARATSKQLTANYVAQYTQLTQRILPAAATRAAAPAVANGNGASHHEVAGAAQAAPYDPQGLSHFLDQLSDFDTAMLQPVEESKVLAGLSAADIAAAAARVQLQPVCRAVLQRALAAGLPTHVLSINWCSQMVQQALSLGPQTSIGSPAQLQQAGSNHSVAALLAAPTKQQQEQPAGEAGSWVVANQLEEVDGVTTGRIRRTICSARDKAWAYDALVRASGNASGWSVYVGDSVTDIAALLQADYGIVVGSSSSLRRVCQRFGVTLKPLITAPLEGPGPKGVLYEAASWAEIEAFLFGPRSYEAHPYKTQMQAVRRSWSNLASPTTPPPTGAPNSSTPSLLQNAAGNGDAAMQGSATAVAAALAAGVSGAPRVPRVLTVAGSDSGGGAGIQADLKAMQACGVFGTSAITALTAQNTHGVQAVHVPPADTLAAQIDSVLSDIGVHVVKTGMLPNAETVKLVADKVAQYGVRLLVVDPVMVSTSGHSLAEQQVVHALLTHLLPHATLVTPNIPEASALLGGNPIHTVADMCEAAKQLHAKAGGCHAVLIKGGHLLGSSPDAAQVVTDVLYDGKELHVMEAPAVQTPNMHGTGCTLASATAAFLARGQPLVVAVQSARAYLHDCLKHSTLLRIGSGTQCPFNHGWQVADWQQDAAAAGQPAQLIKEQLAAVPGVSRWDPRRVAQAMALYAVTDSGMNTKHGRSLGDAVRAAVAGGATIIQVREKEVDGGLFLERAREALKVCRAAGVPLVINDRVDIALALGPDVGVHVGQADIPLHVVRHLLGPSRLLGCSTKTVEQARTAVQAGADYLGVGAVYPTSTHKNTRVIGTDGLAAVVAAAGIPVVAIGGIKTHHIPEVLKAGADGIAVVSAIFDVPDIMRSTQELHDVVMESLAAAKASPHAQ